MRFIQTDRDVSEARRKFLASCTGIAEATPPATNLLLAASERNYDVAHSDGGRVAQDMRSGPAPARPVARAD